jgi:hypothetical protein
MRPFLVELRSESLEELLQIGLQREKQKIDMETQIEPVSQLTRDESTPECSPIHISSLKEKTSIEFQWTVEHGTTYNCPLYK